MEAVIVDFCPANGCLWNSTERAFNVDIYGQETWKALGGGLLEGKLHVEIAWPAGLVPNAATSASLSFTLFWLFALL